MNLFIFTHTTKHSSPPGFYQHHSRQKEITHFPKTKVFENLLFPGEMGRRMSLSGKQKNPYSSGSRHINNSLSVYFFIGSELNKGGMKVEVKRDFKSYFLSPKINRKPYRLCMTFSSTPNTCVQRCLYPLFQNQPSIFCCSIFFEECEGMDQQNGKRITLLITTIALQN